MKTAVNQPTFFSWLGYFELINYVDNFVFLDNVPFGNKPKRINRNIIANEEGEKFNITLSIKKPNQLSYIKDCNIIVDKNTEKSKNLILDIYKNSKFYNEVSSIVLDIYSFKSENLAEFNINLIKKICNIIDINCQFYQSSKDFDFKDKLTNSEYYNKIADNLKSTSYCTFSTGYKSGLYKPEDFFSNNKKFIVQDYKHPAYKRSKIFIPYLSIIDLLFNNFENSKQIILEGSNWIKYERN